MATISTKKETQRFIDEDGNVQESTKESTLKIEKSKEPDYIKLYTRVWCEFNQIPTQWRTLFLELVSRMTYCNSEDLSKSQLVCTGKPFSDDISNALGIGIRQYQKGIKCLCDCNAIKKVSRGVYQINPTYAGRGEWKYNPKFHRGGVEDLVATFNFKTGEVDTRIIWADDGSDDDMNKMYRDGLGVGKDEQTILKSSKYQSTQHEEQLQGQLSIYDMAKEA
jgi:hypothetical protein